MKRMAVLMLLIIGVACVNLAFAQKPTVVASDKSGWHKIGEVTANFKTETESIVVLGKDQFKSLKLKVTDAPINIESVQVVYESGEKEDLTVQSELQAGNETKVLDLKNSSKEIDKVVFKYKTMPSYRNEKAHVELYGLKS